MKKQLLFGSLLLSLFALIFFSSCEKDATDSSPVITLEKPSDGGEFANAEEVHIEGNVSDEDLHELKIQLVNEATGAVLFSHEPTIHDMTTYDFHTHFKVSAITEHITVKLNIEVADHSGHVSSKSVALHFIP